MKTIRITLAVCLIFLVSPLFAQRKITIKMASPIPENTPWGHFFNQLADDWKKITGGEVDLIVYHNGVAGSESDVVRSLKLNQIQAAVLSTLGLYEISPEIMTLSCPFLIRNDDELDLVLAGLTGELEEKINGKGYFTLAWARVGWVKFFSKSPVFVPADLKKQKLGTNADQAELNHVFKAMGFQMVPVERNDILIALSSGMAEAVFQSPVAVGSTQVFGLAKNMASINVAPFLGGLIFNQRAWRSIPDKYKPQMIDAVRKNEAKLDRDIRKLEDDMIKTMGNYGLKVNQLNPQQEQLWYDEIGRAMPSLIGTIFDRNIYGRVETMLQNYRNERR
ncbi:MAG: TRAP transporter substrate-binding protein DctP [Treponema sp.]|jgi:TRAP-type C4-dicarboxylate transport system substrate-binding protein|nr:TRAP transporter substrate-binding protein DctP [Treponema sp.]